MYRPRRPRRRPGRLAGVTRWRVAASIAVLGIAAAPALSSAAQAGGASTLHVTVKPRTGSPDTHFAISFRAPETTGTVDTVRRAYRVTVGEQSRTGCTWSAAGQPPPAKAGANVRVVLSPGKSRSWCAGTFSGTVWETESIVCQPTQVCPDLVVAPRKIGTFSFRVTRG
jgi:hypothetical protein